MSVNDGVMGGLSRGGPKVTDKHKLLFKGEISLENNGGFSSIRTRGKTLDLTAYDGLEIKVKGDGRMYYLTTRAGGNRMLAFWSPVQPPKGEWAVIRVAFDSFDATYFGKKIPVMKLNTKNITSVGFMLYDKKAGPFAIEVEYIKAYKDAAK
jgi:monofunctional biosynthetic peptidoglycan transglycosylase